MTLTEATDVKYRNYVPYYVSTNGNILKVEKYLADGTTVEVEGSPIPDGGDRQIVAVTFQGPLVNGARLRLTPVGGDTELQFGPIKS